MKSPFLRISEAAEFARVNRSTLFRWISKGLIKRHTVGKRVGLIKASDLEALIESESK